MKAVVREALLPNLARIESRVGAYEGPSRKLLDEILGTIGGVFGRTRAGAIPKIIIAESGNFPELVRFYLDEVIRRAFALLSRVLARGVASGEFRPIDVANTVRILAGSMLFPAAAIVSFLATIDALMSAAGKWLRAYALVISVAALLVSGYLAAWGMIAFRPWSF